MKPKAQGVLDLLPLPVLLILPGSPPILFMF